jgi:peroxin-5
VWNKLGACCAYLKEREMAMEAYHKALEIKPNYIRCWVNLGMSHAGQ